MELVALIVSLLLLPSVRTRAARLCRRSPAMLLLRLRRSRDRLRAGAVGCDGARQRSRPLRPLLQVCGVGALLPCSRDGFMELRKLTLSEGVHAYGGERGDVSQSEGLEYEWQVELVTMRKTKKSPRATTLPRLPRRRMRRSRRRRLVVRLK